MVCWVGMFWLGVEFFLFGCKVLLRCDVGCGVVLVGVVELLVGWFKKSKSVIVVVRKGVVL